MDTCRIVIALILVSQSMFGQQFSRPDNTVNASGFGTTGCASRHECVNEVVADNNTSYLGTNVADDFVYFDLSDATAPPNADDQVLRVVMACQGGSANVLVLVQDLTVGTLASTNHTVSGTYAAYELAVPTLANDYTALRTQVYVVSTTGTIRVTQVEFQIELGGGGSTTVNINGVNATQVNGVVPASINGT